MLFVYFRNKNFYLYEIIFMYSPLPINDTLSPFDHFIYEISPKKPTTDKIRIRQFCSVKNAINGRNWCFPVLIYPYWPRFKIIWAINEISIFRFFIRLIFSIIECVFSVIEFGAPSGWWLIIAGVSAVSTFNKLGKEYNKFLLEEPVDTTNIQSFWLS